jgi:hypothetical protein
MSGGLFCSCEPVDRSKWVVIDRLCSYSAFSGYHRKSSDWSSVGCTGCGHMWRTKAAYVASLPDLPTALRGAHLEGLKLK